MLKKAIAFVIIVVVVFAAFYYAPRVQSPAPQSSSLVVIAKPPAGLVPPPVPPISVVPVENPLNEKLAKQVIELQSKVILLQAEKLEKLQAPKPKVSAPRRKKTNIPCPPPQLLEKLRRAGMVLK